MRMMLIAFNILFLLTSSAIVCASVFHAPEDFQFLARIKGPIKKDGIYRVCLSSEILRKCSSGCGDLRVFDPNNKEIPYVIIDNKSTDKKIDTYILEITEYKDSPESAILTMKMPKKYEPISQIDIDTPERDFKKNVKVYGSDNMKIWHLIAEDAVYDFSSQVDLRKTKIEFSESNHRYYRVRLVHTGKPDKMNQSIRLKYNGLDFSVNNLKSGMIRINRVMGKASPVRKTFTKYDEFTFSNFSSVIDKERNTVITLESGLPFNRITFEIDNPYFYRGLKVFYSETGIDDSYSLLTHGQIYRFQISGLNETKDFLEYTAAKHKYIKFIIENNNNPPLEIRNIKFSWVRKSLYFIALVDAPEYTMYFSNPNTEKPVYDISNFINQGNWNRHTYESLDTAPLQQNVDYKPSVSKDRKTGIEKFILTLIVILLVVGIGYWLYVLMRKAEEKKEGH